MARQPQETLKAIGMMIRQLPPEYGSIWEGFARDTRFQFTGDKTWFDLPVGLKLPPDFDPGVMEDMRLRNLRYQGRYAEILQRLAMIEGPLLPSDNIFQSYNLGQSPPPVARLRGWAHLLMGDRVAAMADGREILAFKDLAPPGLSGDAGWLDKLRRAEGHMFAGQPKQAVALARAGMNEMPRTRNALLWDYATSMGAAVLAWSGQEEEAAQLLEILSTEIPGLAPASITRDPVYAVPLKDNARYQALSARLEALMARTNLD
jgi:hypothetical protein